MHIINRIICIHLPEQATPVITLDPECVGEMADAVRHVTAGDQLHDVRGTLVVGGTERRRADGQIVTAGLEPISDRVTDANVEKVRARKSFEGSRHARFGDEHGPGQPGRVPPAITLIGTGDKHLEIID